MSGMGSPGERQFWYSTLSTTFSPFSHTVMRLPTMRMRQRFQSPIGLSAHFSAQNIAVELFQMQPEPRPFHMLGSQIWTWGMLRM